MAPKSPRVLHIISRRSYYGAENVVNVLVQGLHERGLVVGLASFYPSPNQDSAPEYPYFPVNRRGRTDLTFFPRLVGAIRSFAPDIVHTHVHNGKYWGRVAAIAAGVPIIVHTEHNSDFRAHPLAYLVNRFILNPKTARTIAFTRYQAEALRRAESIRGDRLVVIPNGISSPPPTAVTLRELFLPTKAAPVIAHVGRLSAVKNQTLALHAFAEFLPSRPDAHLVFIGDGADRANLQALQRELHLEDRVHFAGFRSDARALLGTADLLLVTSQNEAMPIAVLEALFAGVPVVSTPWSGVEEILEEGRLGVIAESMKPSAVASALVRAIADPESPARTKLARATAESRYSVGAYVEAHKGLYETLYAQHNRLAQVTRGTRQGRA